MRFTYLRALVLRLLRLSLRTRFFLHLALIFAQIGLLIVSAMSFQDGSLEGLKTKGSREKGYVQFVEDELLDERWRAEKEPATSGDFEA